MKREYLVHLRPLFESELARRGFTLAGKAAQSTSSSATIYVRKVNAQLWLLAVLRPNPRQEMFHLELGWSRTQSLPHRGSAHIPAWVGTAADLSLSDRIVEFTDLNLRYTGKGKTGWVVWECSADPYDPNFLDTFMREDALAVSDSQAEARCRAAVAACMVDFDRVALPFFREVAGEPFEAW